MSRIVQIPIFLIAFFILNQKVFAQTLAGGEVYYELISPLKYKVTAHVYRLCDYSPLNSLNANVYGGATSVPLNFQRISISKINDTCNNPCNKQNAISNPGFEKHTFIDTVDFNYAPYNVFVSNGICTVNFGVRQSGRVPSLSTLPSGNFYLDASTNICLSNITNNISPQFSLEPKFKVGCNQPTIYSPGIIDTTDNDSFAFELAEVESNYNTAVSYNGSFNSQIPMTPFCLPTGVINCKAIPTAKPPRGFYLDPLSGNLVLTPSNCTEVGVVKIKVNEFRYNSQTRAYEWLGYVCREMTIEVVNLNGNRLPVINPTITTNDVCELSNVCFLVKASDADTTDTTQMFWDFGKKEASFNIKDSTTKDKEATLCWFVKEGTKKRENFFVTIGAMDQQCNLNLTSKTYRFNIRPAPKYSYSNTLGNCGQLSWVSSVYDSIYPKVVGTCSTTIKSLTTNKILYKGNGLFGATTINENGMIAVEHAFAFSAGSTCLHTVIDTLTIANAIEIPSINNNKDSVVCENAMISFKFNKGPIKNIKGFSWFVNRTMVNQKDTIINVKIIEDSRVKIIVENNSGCFSEFGVRYNLKRHYPMVSTDETVCYGTEYKVVSNVFGLKKPIRYNWKINGVDTIANDSNLLLKINTVKKVILMIEDSIHCRFTDSVLLDPWPQVNFHLSSKSSVCVDSMVQVHAQYVNAMQPAIYNWITNADTIINADSILNFQPKGNTIVRLKVVDNNSCSFEDSTSIVAIKTPIVTINDYNLCPKDSIVITPVINNKSSSLNYVWRINKKLASTDSLLKLSPKATVPIQLKVSNNYGCSSEDSAMVQVYPVSNFKIMGVGNYHPSSFIVLHTTDTFNTFVWFNGNQTDSNAFWANNLGAPGKYKIWCRANDRYGCHYQDTLEINTNSFLKINEVDYNGIHIYPNPIISDLNIEINETTHIELYTIDGKLMLEKNLPKGLNTIDMKNYSTGLYVLKAMVNGQVVNMRIVKD